ncbi:hypothetical protein [uncultured Pontibacter sp.]|uniref:hypothetical protein n=1 Tax=uncultured Pontibacter sp. TaxID=453356 RepID=UPI0026083533|nr:hypothetical protein [uncultured Pontibacter sp.]
MRQLKEKTASISCRVPVDTKQKFIEMSDILQLSLAQYVALLVHIGDSGEAGFKEVEKQLEDAYATQKALKEELQKYKDLLPFAQAPYLTPLTAILQNDQILKELYENHRKEPLAKAILLTKEFQFNVMLEAKFFEKTTYYSMGGFGWTYMGKDRNTVTIRKF